MKKIIRQISLILTAITLAAVIGLALLDSVVMPYLVDVPSIRAPNLQNLTVPKAKLLLDQWGLGIAIGDSLHHETISAGAVIDQDPALGQRIKKGRRIVVTLSKGPRYYEVPDVRRVSLREARLQLEGNQLKIGEIFYLSSNSIPEDAIVNQTPSAGTRLPSGSLVDLKISNGPSTAPKRIPNLVGLSIEVVEDTLRKYEMRLGKIDNRVDNQQPIGTILAQTPDHRERALRQSRIDLVLSVTELSPIPSQPIAE